ncbi:MAG: LEA type 2 family protein [Thiopseudomonas sp.]|nr:LEA type 2 family protein [Thiopseudomonas sp.]MCK9465691.1 LEA type 2 family protein [Thiopseudomonas sp.]
MVTSNNLGKWKTAFLFILVANLASGCSTWFSTDFAEPDVQLVDVEVIHARLLEQQFKLYFRIDNPNSSSLPVRGINYEIHLNGVPLGKGKSNKWVTVPAHGHAYFDLPVHTNIWRHIRTLVRLLEKPDQAVSYALQAEVKTGLLFKKKVKVTRGGSIIPGEFLKD